MSAHGDMCGCGKNGTAEAHGYDHHVRGAITRAEGGGYAGHPVDAHPMSCDDVNAIRARVAADLTREAMNPFQRVAAWAQGHSGGYSDAAWEAAWAQPSTADADEAAR